MEAWTIKFSFLKVEIESVTELWAGSIEVGVTSHDPENIVLPPTMTSMASGTWMLSGRSVIVNGQEAKRDYSSINLETLKVHKSLHNIDCKKYVFVGLSVNYYQSKIILIAVEIFRTCINQH